MLLVICLVTHILFIFIQDTELMRRQALERRLESDEAKKHEKTKKKKKMAF